LTEFFAGHAGAKKEHQMTDETKTADQVFLVNDDAAEPHAVSAAAETALVPVRAPFTGALATRKTGRKVVTTLTLSSRTCKWPFGDPATSDFHYCGQPPQSGRPYCDEHDRMSYQATPRKKVSPSFR
jgi:hypothetical protein